MTYNMDIVSELRSLGVVVLLLLSSEGVAPQTHSLVFNPCEGCSINAFYDESYGLGSDAFLGSASNLTLLRDGKIAVVFNVADTEFTVFSADSTWSVEGRAGEGPGEYKWIQWLRSWRGEVHVFDPFQPRVTVLDEDFEVVREGAYPIRNGLNDIAVVDDSLYVVNASLFAPARAGFVLHSFSVDGTIQRSFDEITEGAYILD